MAWKATGEVAALSAEARAAWTSRAWRAASREDSKAG